LFEQINNLLRRKRRRKRKAKRYLFNCSELTCHIIYQPRRGVACYSILCAPGGLPSILPSHSQIWASQAPQTINHFAA